MRSASTSGSAGGSPRPAARSRAPSPSSALVAIRDDGSSLGDVLVVDVGYNDDPALYRAGMDQVIHAAHALGVKRVVWVTLRASWQVLPRRRTP